jgi:AraC-like DNA-binding protein
MTEITPRCPPCQGRMDFQRVDPGVRGFENHIFECGGCYTMKTKAVSLSRSDSVAARFRCGEMGRELTQAAGMSDYREIDARAQEALEAARKLPQGAARSKAMKDAGELRVPPKSCDWRIVSSSRRNESPPTLLNPGSCCVGVFQMRRSNCAGRMTGDVGRSLGYTSESAFSNPFKRVTGKSPIHFRNAVVPRNTSAKRAERIGAARDGR